MYLSLIQMDNDPNYARRYIKTFRIFASQSFIDAAPNANAATLTGSVLNLQPASATFDGVVITGPQNFTGAKTFASPLTALLQIAFGI